MAFRLISAGILSVLAFALWAATSPTTQIQLQDTSETNTEVSESIHETAIVTRVLDGDTIEINDSFKVRLIGIDAPEIDTSECYALDSRAFLVELLLGESVRLERDTSNLDRYDRSLRYVYTDDPRTNISTEVLVNEVLIAEGYARATPIEPDTYFADVFKIAQDSARSATLGIWSNRCVIE